MKDPGNSSTSEVMKKLDEQYQKYRYMEGSLTHKKKKWGFVLLCVFLMISVVCWHSFLEILHTYVWGIYVYRLWCI